MDNSKIYHIERREGQLIDLINLADDVSVNIEMMRERKSRTALAASISIILSVILALFALNNTFLTNQEQIFTLSFLLVSISVGIIIYSLKSLYDAHKLDIEVEYEGYILGDLLNQIDSYKSLIMTADTDPIKKSYIEMRLSRINFKHAKFKRGTKASRTKHAPTIAHPTPSTSQTST